MIRHVTMDTFKKTKGVSYSRLSKLADGPQAYKKGLEEDLDSPALTLGSAVDLLLTNPEEFDKEIFVMSVEKPGSDMMCIFCEVFAETGNVKEAHRASGYRITEDATLIKFEKEGKMYADALIKASGKKVISFDDFTKANTIITQLRNNEFTKPYFGHLIKENKHIELLFQVPIIWDLPYIDITTGKMSTTPAKSIIDLVYIDHMNRVVKPIELKTGEYSFFKTFWKYKRYIQGGMYTDALRQMTDSIEEQAALYDVEPIRFIYADTNLYYPPTIYKMTEQDISIARNGIKYQAVTQDKYLNMYKYKGYSQLVAELKWHEKNNKWNYSYDVYQNNGEIDIDYSIVKL